MNLSAQTFWIAIGFAGQALFSARFLIQWIASERARKSVVPKLFWYFSIAGGATLLLTRFGAKIRCLWSDKALV